MFVVRLEGIWASARDWRPMGIGRNMGLTKIRMPSMLRRFAVTALVVLSAHATYAQTTGVTHGVRPARLVIRNATMVDGNGTPARGPVDIVLEGNKIVDVVPLDPVAMNRGNARRPVGDVQIDATGKYVLPGLINAHGHLQSNRSGHSLGGYEYNLKLWLANGITTVREVGPESDTGIITIRDRSARGEIVAPRIFSYPMLTENPNPRTRLPRRERAHSALQADRL